jgi:hypothetical protein
MKKEEIKDISGHYWEIWTIRLMPIQIYDVSVRRVADNRCSTILLDKEV